MSNLTLQFDLTARREKNLRVLQSVDDSIYEIIDDCSHVAVYEFDAASKSWDRLDVEGSLFITRSLYDPLYSLVVLNKKGPSDFALDLSTVLKISLQKPYVMLRCSTPSQPIVFGLWSHDNSELESLHSLLVRIAINKETPVAPPSPQAKASQLLSLLKVKASTPTTGAGPLSPAAATLAATTVTPPSGPSTGTGESLNKAMALLSALKSGSKPSPAAPAAVASPGPVASPIVGTAATPPSTESAHGHGSGSDNAVKSAQLLSILKPAGTGGPSAGSATQLSPAAVASSKATTTVDEARRAELMLKLIKPRATTVEDLLTDVDIAAKVKASGTTPAPSSARENTSAATQNGSAVPATSEVNKAESRSKEEALLRLVKETTSGSGKFEKDASAGRGAPSPTPAIPIPIARASPKTGGLPPRPADRQFAASPPGSVGGLSVAASMFAPAAPGNSGAQRPTLRTHQRSPSASPVLMGQSGPSSAPGTLTAPIAWASLSSTTLASSAGTSSGITTGITHSQSLGNLSSSSSAPSAAAPSPLRPSAPMLISPSDLRSKAAPTGGLR